jgi:hypothetical protein
MTTRRASPPLASPRVFFIVGSLGALLLLTLSPLARVRLGLLDYNRWFLDSYAVLASNDAARAGYLDADAPNPYDVLHRPNSYSDWWFGLGKLGLTREDNFMVGGSWVLAFLAAVFLTLRPRDWGEALWLVLLVTSPPVMLGIMRANNDLVVFAVLAVAIGALRAGTGWRLALATAAVALATGLKFYPAAAGFVFLLIPGPRRMLLVAGCATLLLGAVLVSVSSQLHRGIFDPGSPIHAMGGQIWLWDLGLNRRAAAIGAFFLLGAAAVVVAWQGWTTGLALREEDPEPRVAMTLAGALLVCCFLGTINHDYRWIFSLWLAPWLWRQRQRKGAARIAVWLLPFVLWHDGVLCLVLSSWFPDLASERYSRIFWFWRLGTEPFTWLLLSLLGGWLLNLLSARWQEVRSEFFASKPEAGQARRQV